MSQDSTRYPLPGQRPAMSARDRRRVLIGIAVAVVVLMIAGGAAAWYSRNDTICSDGKPPLRQHPGIALGQIEYLCQNGELVTK